MVNYDKNVQGAKREQARLAHEAKVKAKQEKEAARREAAKAKRDERNRELLESIADQIDQSEEHAYGEVYSELCQEDDEPPSVFDPQVLKFLATHTDIQGGERLADALRQVLAPAEDKLQFPHFLEFLRENAVADCTAVSQFLETCQGHDAVAKTECAAHALHVAQKMVSLTFEKEKWDVLLEAVMKGLDHMVGLQDFVQMCKKLSRCARLLQFLEVELQQESLPALSGKDLKHWKALSEDVAARLEQQPGLRGPRSESQPFLSEPLEVIAECDPIEGRTSDSASKCDLCKAGICAYHTQRAQPVKGSVKMPAAKVRMPPSNKLEARQGLEEAMTSLADLVLQLEDAILAAFDAGLEEDELLPAFKRLEELRNAAP